MRKTNRVTLTGWLPAETVVAHFSALSPGENVVWFDAGADADGRLAAPRDGHPHRSLVGWGSEILRAWAREPGSLDAAWSRIADDTAEGGQDHDPLGWWGYLGYGAGADLLAPGDVAWADALGDPGHPDLALLSVDRALVFDHDAGTVDVVTRGDHAAWADELVSWWASASARLPAVAPPVARQAEWADTGPEYLRLIERCQAAIREGDAFVMCLTTSVAVRGVEDDDLTLYRLLRRASPAPRACFVRIDGFSLLSATPETFLTVGRDGTLSSSPIKGTRPRHADPVVDAAVAEQLRTDPKERAENLMIVDLLRNDLSRVSVPGGVAIDELFEVRSYEHVHQLTSTIHGRLRPGLTGVDAVRAAFPPGSMTGAPKHSVVGLLGAWETAPRGVYSGAVGRFGFDGTVDLSVVIRSILLDSLSGVATIGVGGGITALSSPLDELAEVRTKAQALLAVLGASPGAGPRGDAFDAVRDVSLI